MAPPRPAASLGPAPSAQLTHAARAGGVQLEATRTLAHGAAGPQHAAAAHAAALVRILLGAVLLCAASRTRRQHRPGGWGGLTPACAPPDTHRGAASPAVGGSRPRRNCSHSAMWGTEILGGAGSGQRGQCTQLLPPIPSGPTLPWSAHQLRGAGTGGIGHPNRGPGDSNSPQR